MKKKNDTFSVGIVLGFLIPMFVYLLLNYILQGLEAQGLTSTEGFSPFFRQRTTAIVAIAANALVLRIFTSRRYVNAIRGIVVPTALYVILWFYLFGHIIFGDI